MLRWPLRGMLLALLCLACSPSARAADDKLQIAGLRLGIGGRYKTGVWTPVSVTLRGGSAATAGHVSVIAADDDGVPVRFCPAGDPAVKLLSDQETTVELTALFGRQSGGPVSVEFRSGDAPPITRTFDTAATAEDPQLRPPLDPNQPLIVVVGPAGDAWSRLLPAAGSAMPAEVVRVDALDALPRTAAGLEGVTAVVLSTSAPEIFARTAAGDPRWAALDAWIRGGGRVLITGGPGGGELLAQKGLLRPFLPGPLGPPTPARLGGGLETYAGISIPIAVDENDPRQSRIARLTIDTDAAIEVQEADVPLVVRVPRGFGQVIYLALPLDRPPLAGWRGREALVRRLLSIDADHGDEPAHGGQVTHFGFVDLAGQLRKSIAAFPGVALTSFSLVVILILAYLLVVSAADYFLLRKLGGRMVLTWVSFPLAVAVMCGLAYYLAHRGKGDALRLAQADLIDVDTVSHRARITTWANVFSPRTQTYAFTARAIGLDGAEISDARTTIGWFGLSGTALGAMGSNTTNLLQWPAPYEITGDLSRMAQVPIPVWSTRPIKVQGQGTVRGGVEAELAEDDRFLTGTLINTLPFTLSQCMVAYGSWAHDLGTLEPGQAATLGTNTRRSELKTYLVGKKLVRDEKLDKFHQVATPYDRASVVAPYVLQSMALHRAAGGRQYTGLWGGFQGELDATPLLEADRAILIGVGPETPHAAEPGHELLIDGAPLPRHLQNRASVYRFVFRVKPPRP